ncbi:MAG: polysaccharide pyruvyl transferase family protein [Betaproteobacteria bacterium]|nr:polysaccharide pyruvyl transferase family protein [Betaproteobacteria bacterium]
MAAKEQDNRPTIAIMGHVGVGNMGDEAITSSVIQRLREVVPEARLIACSLNPRDTAARHSIEAFPLRLYTERLLAEPPPDFSWESTYAAKSKPAPVDPNENKGIAGFIRSLPWLKAILRPFVIAARWVPEAWAMFAFDWRCYQRLKGTTFLFWAGSGQISDYVDGLGYPLVILRWTILARLRGAKVAFASAGAGPVTHPISKLCFGLALKLAHYRSFRDPYSIDAARLLGSPEPNHFIRDFAFSHPLLPGLPPRTPNPVPWVGINPLPFFGGEYWHVLDPGIYDRYVTAHAELCIGLLRKGRRVTLFASNIRVDPRSVRAIVERVRELDASVIDRLEIERTLRDVPDVFSGVRAMDVVVATRYHGVLLSLACGTPAVAVVYHEKTRHVAEHMGMGAWCVRASDATGAALLDRTEDLLANLDQARATLDERRRVDVPSLMEQYRLFRAMALGEQRAAP